MGTKFQKGYSKIRGECEELKKIRRTEVTKWRRWGGRGRWRYIWWRKLRIKRKVKNEENKLVRLKLIKHIKKLELIIST